MRLDIENTLLVLIDVQEKLAAAMHERDDLFRAVEVAVRGCRALDVPVIWLEQLPDKMGPTIGPLKQVLTGQEPLVKACFSCADLPRFREAIEATGRRQLVLCGIEAHVCVYQTAADLIGDGYEVTVLADGVSSRSARNRQVGIERIAALGGQISSAEMMLFELMRTSEHAAFRDILRIVR